MRPSPFSTKMAKNTAFHVISVSSVTSQFCSNVKPELPTNNYTSVMPRTKRGEEISFLLTLESEEAIKNLGFGPKATYGEAKAHARSLSSRPSGLRST